MGQRPIFYPYSDFYLLGNYTGQAGGRKVSEQVSISKQLENA